MAATYGSAFFDTIRKGCQESAAAVAPIVDRLVAGPDVNTVIDVGCGEGHWGKAFEALGWFATGIDGPDTPCVLDRFIPHDLRQPLPKPIAPSTMAVCLEVAEHLPPERAQTFVADLCTLAPVVLFSAAVPGQGGHGHLHEMWPAYWGFLFEQHGFAVTAALRWQIWNDVRVECWYRQNLLFVTSEPERWPDLFVSPLRDPFPVVHPVLYDGVRSRR